VVPGFLKKRSLMNAFLLRSLVCSCLCVFLAGCQFSYPFEVTGYVKHALTGEPLAGVKVYSTHFNPDNPVPGEDQPVTVTGADGSFTFTESVRDIHLSQEGATKWVLLFSKDGFKTERADLRGVRGADSAKTTTYVFLVIAAHKEPPGP
jgi:hypothetical protein